MKTRNTIYCLVIRLIITGCQPAAQAKTALADNPQDDKIFTAVDKVDSPGCAAGIIQNGQWVYQHAFGMGNSESKGDEQPECVFAGLNAKQFTAVSNLLLPEQGKLSLSDDVYQYLPEQIAAPKTLGLSDTSV